MKNAFANYHEIPSSYVILIIIRVVCFCIHVQKFLHICSVPEHPTILESSEILCND